MSRDADRDARGDSSGNAGRDASHGDASRDGARHRGGGTKAGGTKARRSDDEGPASRNGRPGRPSSASGTGARRLAPSGNRSKAGRTGRPGLEARLVAGRLLAAIVDAKTSADGLFSSATGHPGFRALDPRDQGLAKAIVIAALRHRGTIERRIAACLDRPLPAKAASLKHILHVGAAQILFLDTPDSAAVDLAVAAAEGDSRSARFKALVNAVLRRIAREADGRILAEGRNVDAGSSPEAGNGSGPATAASPDGTGVGAEPAENLPDWLRKRLVAAYGEARTAAIAAAHLLPPPLDLSVKSDPDLWARRLGGIALPTGTVRLAGHDGPVTALAGFGEGEWWVQDAAAALPAKLFGDLAGLRVADLCAAPGGKTAQLVLAGGEVTALEINGNRLKRLDENLSRLGLAATTVLGDFSGFSPDRPFDAVLLDAPCSSTGTIRRHPDVAYTKDAAEIEKLAAVQARLLRAAARIVAPGGRLVFSNCSLDPAEGEAVVAAFLAEEPAFSRDPVRPEEVAGLAAAITPEGDLRTTPEMAFTVSGDLVAAGLDGFFASRLRKD